MEMRGALITQKNPGWRSDHSPIHIVRNLLYVDDCAHFDLILFLMN